MKDLLNKNVIESDRYEEAYEDEMELYDKQIEQKIEQLNNPKGYQSKKARAQLEAEIDELKFAKIRCNRRHQSNKSVNEKTIARKNLLFITGLPDRILNHVLRLSLRRAIFPPTLPQNNSLPRKLRGSICGQAKPKKSDTTVSLFLCFGLPDRIRTCGLKSRSLARYPAAPRADVPLA